MCVHDILLERTGFVLLAFEECIYFRSTLQSVFKPREKQRGLISESERCVSQVLLILEMSAYPYVAEVDQSWVL